MGLVPGKPELVLFRFLSFLPCISLECLAAISPSIPERALLRCPPFLVMQSVNKTEFPDGRTACKREHTSTASLFVVSVTVQKRMIKQQGHTSYLLLKPLINCVMAIPGARHFFRGMSTLIGVKLSRWSFGGFPQQLKLIRSLWSRMITPQLHVIPSLLQPHCLVCTWKRQQRDLEQARTIGVRHWNVELTITLWPKISENCLISAHLSAL